MKIHTAGTLRPGSTERIEMAIYANRADARPPLLHTLGRWATLSASIGIRPDTMIFAGIILLLNAHLLLGYSCRALVFFPDKWLAGDWYRIVTHPFVHLTWYHFLLDAGAFLLLYGGLSEERMGRRLFHAGICGAAGLAAAWGFDPQIRTLGLCGLSGTAHGLMAVSALEMMQKKSEFTTGVICLAVVLCKSVYEAASGTVLFSFLQFGLCGTPLAVCHLGGTLGGMASVLFCLFCRPEAKQPAGIIHRGL